MFSEERNELVRILDSRVCNDNLVVAVMVGVESRLFDLYFIFFLVYINSQK